MGAKAARLGRKKSYIPGGVKKGRGNIYTT